jgi:ANTAR domain
MPVDVQGQPTAGRLALLSRIRAERDRTEDLYARTRAAVARSHALVQANQRIRGSKGRPGSWSRELLERSPYARLAAQAASMPVIEQAKGIVMAQAGCDEEQAFGLLRRASQRKNVPVRELAAQIVARTAQRDAGTGQGRVSRARR